MRRGLPGGLHLAAVRDLLRDALVVGSLPGNLGEGQFESHEGKALQDRRVEFEGEGLRGAFGIKIFVPGEFGVVPGIPELAGDMSVRGLKPLGLN